MKIKLIVLGYNHSTSNLRLFFIFALSLPLFGMQPTN